MDALRAAGKPYPGHSVVEERRARDSERGKEADAARELGAVVIVRDPYQGTYSRGGGWIALAEAEARTQPSRMRSQRGQDGSSRTVAPSTATLKQWSFGVAPSLIGSPQATLRTTPLRTYATASNPRGSCLAWASKDHPKSATRQN